MLPAGPLVCGYVCWDIFYIFIKLWWIPLAKYNILGEWPPVHSLETDPLCVGLWEKSSPFGAPDVSFRVWKLSLSNSCWNQGLGKYYCCHLHLLMRWLQKTVAEYCPVWFLAPCHSERCVLKDPTKNRNHFPHFLSLNWKKLECAFSQKAEDNPVLPSPFTWLEHT